MKIDAITKSVAEAISKIVDESYDSSGAYEKWDPKHPHFVKNYKKFQASNPGSTLTHFIAHLKKGVKEELNIDEANAPSVKIPVKGGMRVYGGAPGGSAKAYKDQHADPFSTTRGPSDTELKDVESEKKKVKKEETSYKGGEFKLYYSDEPYIAEKKIGTLTAFPSYALHEVDSVTEGHRYSLVGWVCGPSFR